MQQNITRRGTAKARHRVSIRDGAFCRFCGRTNGLTLDHVVPRSKGGPSEMSNYQLLCGPCNQSKADSETAWRVNPRIDWCSCPPGLTACRHGGWAIP